jgi:hypothetical protein
LSPCWRALGQGDTQNFPRDGLFTWRPSVAFRIFQQAGVGFVQWSRSNGLLQQAKRAERGYRTASNFISIAYLRMSKLKHLPAHPFTPALAK